MTKYLHDHGIDARKSRGGGGVDGVVVVVSVGCVAGWLADFGPGAVFFVWSFCPGRIIKDIWSLDTIGNAYFARCMVCEPRRFRRVRPRTRSLFGSVCIAFVGRWVGTNPSVVHHAVSAFVSLLVAGFLTVPCRGRLVSWLVAFFLVMVLPRYSW